MKIWIRNNVIQFVKNTDTNRLILPGKKPKKRIKKV